MVPLFWNSPLLFFFSGFPYEKVRERTLYLQVLDYDRFSRNDPIGEVSIPLNKVELGQIKTFWKELKPCSDGSVRTEQIITRLWCLVLALLFALCFKQSHKLKCEQEAISSKKGTNNRSINFSFEMV